LDDAHRDEAADAADHRGLHLEQADGVEKSAGREQDAPARHALHRQLELRVAPEEAVAEPAARALCTPVAGQFAERSFAEQAAREQLALPLQAARETQAERPPKRREPLVPKKAVPRDVLRSAQLLAKTPQALVQLETPQPGAQVLEAPGAESRSPLEPGPLALLPEAQPLPDGSRQMEAQPLVSLPEAEPLAHAWRAAEQGAAQAVQPLLSAA
jgi:hypothetical protein